MATGKLLCAYIFLYIWPLTCHKVYVPRLMQIWEDEREQGGAGWDGDCVWIKHIHTESIITFTRNCNPYLKIVILY